MRVKDLKASLRLLEIIPYHLKELKKHEVLAWMQKYLDKDKRNLVFNKATELRENERIFKLLDRGERDK